MDSLLLFFHVCIHETLSALKVKDQKSGIKGLPWMEGRDPKGRRASLRPPRPSSPPFTRPVIIRSTARVCVCVSLTLTSCHCLEWIDGSLRRARHRFCIPLLYCSLTPDGQLKKEKWKSIKAEAEMSSFLYFVRFFSFFLKTCPLHYPRPC